MTNDPDYSPEEIIGIIAALRVAIRGLIHHHLNPEAFGVRLKSALEQGHAHLVAMPLQDLTLQGYEDEMARLLAHTK